MIYRYAHPELFADWEKPDLTQYSGKLILYGAGRRGRVAAHCLRKLGIDFICFCDSDAKKNNSNIGGYPVISPQELRNKFFNHPILITSQYYHNLESDLKQWGFSKVFSCVGLFLEIDFDGFDDDFNNGFSVEYMCRNTDRYFEQLQNYDVTACGKALFLGALGLRVTSRCNLRCKECISYMPYYKKQRDFDTDKMFDSIDRILEICEIGRLEIVGGETFLFAHIRQLLQRLIENPKIERIFPVTNGTILPQQDLLDTMKSSKIIVRISDYGKLSNKIDDLKELLKHNGISYEVTSQGRFRESPKLATLNESEEQLAQKAMFCPERSKELSLLDGKLYSCQCVLAFTDLNLIPDFYDSYIDVLDYSISSDELKSKIIATLSDCFTGKPLCACRYCKVNLFSDNLPVAEQTTETLNFTSIDFRRGESDVISLC